MTMDRKHAGWTAGALLALLTAATTGALARNAADKPAARITPNQAKQIALKKYPHASVDPTIPLEHEEGKWQYAVTVHVKTAKGVVMHEVMVGATSGKIEADEVTTTAEEAKEKAADEKAARAKSSGRKSKK
jgi:gas vesicle protein